MGNIPEIREDQGVKTLFVKDRPFFVRGGELHNSSSSSLEYMEKNVWPCLKGLHMNTVVLPVAWETIEPEEGCFDFSVVKGLIDQARREQMHLVILWFGLWKNSESNYVPGWVKQDTDKYFRVQDAWHKPLNIISPLCEAAVAADARAFAKLMAYIYEVDAQENTVIFVQIENEIGILGAMRDYSPAGEAGYGTQVPDAVSQEFRVSGTWEQAFGGDGPEYFMAWSYGQAVEKIAQAGKAQYPLPFYVNAWLWQYPFRPGTYPCGGPVMKMSRMWRLAAPSLFCLAPDIYVPNTADVIDEYAGEGNPLFIPEIRKDPSCASFVLYAFGRHNAIGISPFGIEDLQADPDTLDKIPFEVLMLLNIDGTAMDGTGTAPYLAKSYEIMEHMEPIYMQYRNTPHLQSFIKRNENDLGTYLHFEKYDVLIGYDRKEAHHPVAAGMIIELNQDEFLCIGTHYKFTFYPKGSERTSAQILSAEEGHFENGQWKRGRVLNGDERQRIVIGDMPEVKKVRVYQL